MQQELAAVRRQSRPSWRHVLLFALKKRIEYPRPPFISPPWPDAGFEGILSFGFYVTHKGCQD
jgi:hypothetical protein